MRLVRYPARITLAVPQEIHDTWVNKVPREQKEVIKLAFIELVKNRADIKIQVKQEQSMTVYNVVMPHIEVKPVIKNENRQESVRALDPEITQEYVNALKAELKKAKEVIKRKNEELKRLRGIQAELRKYVDEVNALRSQLSKCREEGVAEGVRRVKGKVYELLKHGKITRSAAFALLNAIDG